MAAGTRPLATPTRASAWVWSAPRCLLQESTASSPGEGTGTGLGQEMTQWEMLTLMNTGVHHTQLTTKREHDRRKTMTRVKQGLLLFIVLPVLWLPFTGWASHDQVECTSKPKNVKAVRIASVHIANVNFI